MISRSNVAGRIFDIPMFSKQMPDTKLFQADIGLGHARASSIFRFWPSHQKICRWNEIKITVSSAVKVRSLVCQRCPVKNCARKSYLLPSIGVNYQYAKLKQNKIHLLECCLLVCMHNTPNPFPSFTASQKVQNLAGDRISCHEGQWWRRAVWQKNVTPTLKKSFAVNA